MSLTTPIFYSAVLFLATLAGGLIPTAYPNLKDSVLKIFVSLGAGVLLGMALLHLIPESLEQHSESFGVWILAGFVLLFVLERFVMIHACEEGECHYHTVGIAAFIGLAVHGAIEGLAVATSLAETNIAALLVAGIAIHKIPAAFALASILRLTDLRKKTILAFIIGVGISTPIGLIGGTVFLQNVKMPHVAGVLLALSAGTFLYIATCDLIPEIHRSQTDRVKRLIAFLSGIAFCFLEFHAHTH